MLDRRSDVDYDVALDDEALEWLRVRIWLDRGQVTRFAIQYETTLAGERAAVVRYDTAHGYAHRDQMYRSRKPVKTELDPSLSYAELVDFAEQDLRQHWRRYRSEFEDQP